MTLKIRVLRCSRRLFIILVSLTVTLFSEKMLISNRCWYGFMSNLIKKSWKDSNGGIYRRVNPFHFFYQVLRRCWKRPKSDFQKSYFYVKNGRNLFDFFLLLLFKNITLGDHYWVKKNFLLQIWTIFLWNDSQFLTSKKP